MVHLNHPDPDKPTPLGCLVGCFALVALGLGCLGLFIAWKARVSEKFDAEKLETLVYWGGGSVLVGLIGLFIAARLLGAFIEKGPPSNRGGLN